LQTRHAAAAAVTFALALGASANAQAHFVLGAPPAWRAQDSLGSPQKLGPCGDEGASAETMIVTSFHAGETITLTWQETIPHDGWYRIAIAYRDRSEFVDPSVLIGSDGNSLDAGIEDPTVLPVLADGLFPHTAASIGQGKAYSYDLKLPMTPCDKCTLQVIQFMANHGSNLGTLADGTPNPDGYFYHHCADIQILAPDGGADAGVAEDAGADAGEPGDASAPSAPSGMTAKGGGCSVSPHGAGEAAVELVGLLGLVALFQRRRAAVRRHSSG
jgi:MYXO-CTERM domain-containing protein